MSTPEDKTGMDKPPEKGPKTKTSKEKRPPLASEGLSAAKKTSGKMSPLFQIKDKPFVKALLWGVGLLLVGLWGIWAGWMPFLTSAPSKSDLSKHTLSKAEGVLSSSSGTSSPSLVPPPSSALSVSSTSSLEALSARVRALEAVNPTLHQTLHHWVEEIKERYDTFEKDLHTLETEVSHLKSLLEEDPSPDASPAVGDRRGTPARDRAAFRNTLQTAQKHFAQAQKELTQAQDLYARVRAQALHFLKAFALYEALKASWSQGKSFLEPLQALQHHVGQDFEKGAFDLLTDLAALGVPSYDSLVKESEGLLETEASFEEAPKPGAQQQTLPFFERAVIQLKSLIKIRPTHERASEEEEHSASQLDSLEKVYFCFQRGAIEAGLAHLASLEKVTPAIQALQHHARAYVQSHQSLTTIRNHLYSPLFLEESWTPPAPTREDDS